MNKRTFIGMFATLAALVGSSLPASATTYVVTKPDYQTVNTSGVWTTVTNTSVYVNLTSSTFVKARFSAESACYGGSNWCSARIIARNYYTGAIYEFNPAVGTNFAFDTVGSSSDWESHAMLRSRELPAGYYQIYVQAQPYSAGTTFWIDDAQLEVEF